MTLFNHACAQPSPNHSPRGERPDLVENEAVVDVVERCFQVRVENPLTFRVFTLDDLIDRLDRIVTPPAWPKTIRARLEPCLPLRFQRITHPSLLGAISNHRNSEWPEFPIRLRNENPFHRPDTVRRILDVLHQPLLATGGQRDLPVNTGRDTASIALRHLPHTHYNVRLAAKHQLLQAADPFIVPSPRRREDPSPKPLYVLLHRAPPDRIPVEPAVLRSVHAEGRHRHRERVSRHLCPTFPSVPASRIHPLRRSTRLTSAPFRDRAPGPVSGQLSTTTSGGTGHKLPWFPVAFRRTGIRLLSRPLPLRNSASLTVGLPTAQLTVGPQRGFHVSHA